MKKTLDELFVMRVQRGFYSTWNLYPIATTLQDSTADVSMVNIGGGRARILLQWLTSIQNLRIIVSF